MNIYAVLFDVHIRLNVTPLQYLVVFLRHSRPSRMRYFNLTFILFMITSLASCGGGEEEITETNSSIVANNQTRNEVIKEVVLDEGIPFDRENCDKDSTSSWTDFLGISYGMSEVHLDSVLKNKTGGRYSDDTTNFVWFYKGMERVPITVWASARTTQIETIFIEVVSPVVYFESDVAEAIEYYGLPECDAKWLGMQPDEIIGIMGPPDKEESLKDEDNLEVISYVYDFFDEEQTMLRSVVNFRFFEFQSYYCSMVVVTWFY